MRRGGEDRIKKGSGRSAEERAWASTIVVGALRHTRAKHAAIFGKKKIPIEKKKSNRPKRTERKAEGVRTVETRRRRSWSIIEKKKETESFHRITSGDRRGPLNVEEGGEREKLRPSEKKTKGSIFRTLYPRTSRGPLEKRRRRGKEYRRVADQR